MWYEEAVFYQVFPLGFCDGLRDNDGVMNRCISEFADWIPHLQKLGIDAVYFLRFLRAIITVMIQEITV